MNPILRKGTRVLCVEDFSKDPATVSTGKIRSHLHNPRQTFFFRPDGSLLMDEKEVKEAVEQIDDCVEKRGIYVHWDPDSDPFPKRKCFIDCPLAIIEDEDGTQIEIAEIYTVPLNSRIRDRLVNEFAKILEKSGCPKRERDQILSGLREYHDKVLSNQEEAVS